MSHFADWQQTKYHPQKNGAASREAATRSCDFGASRCRIQNGSCLTVQLLTRGARFPAALAMGIVCGGEGGGGGSKGNRFRLTRQSSRTPTISRLIYYQLTHSLCTDTPDDYVIRLCYTLIIWKVVRKYLTWYGKIKYIGRYRGTHSIIGVVYSIYDWANNTGSDRGN